MREQEIELLEYILSLKVMKENDENSKNDRLITAKEKIIEQAFTLLQNEKSGTVSSDFIESPIIVSFCAKDLLNVAPSLTYCFV